jgi:hypothetical protein
VQSPRPYKGPLQAALHELGVGTFGPLGSWEELDKAFAGVEDLVVDCTEMPVQRPSGPGYQSFMYSGKKRPHREAPGRAHPAGANTVDGTLVERQHGRHHGVLAGAGAV